jgi:hypothetical protein
MEKQTGNKIIDMACFLLVVFLMILLSLLVHEKEVIFPEVGAIAAGMFLTPHRSWMTNGKRLFFCLLLCGIAGMAIVRFLPLPLALQMIAAYILALLIQSLSGTSFMPMISALVLPVLLQSRSIWYLYSLVIFSLLILLIRKVLVKSGLKYEEDFIPVQRELPWKLTLFRILVAAGMILLAIGTGWRFMAAPPLLVAFTELSAYKNKVIRMHPIRVILLLTLSAASGAWVRLAFSGLPEGYLILSLLISSILFLIAFYHTGPMVPPAGAAMVLAYLAPKESLYIYPLQIGIGISAYVGLTCLRNFVMQKRSGANS